MVELSTTNNHSFKRKIMNNIPSTAGTGRPNPGIPSMFDMIVISNQVAVMVRKQLPHSQSFRPF